MAKEDNNLPIVSSAELSKVSSNMLNTEQLQHLLQKTPKQHVYSRPAKGGGKWNYVTGTYVKKVLNIMFGWDWSFKVVEHKFDLDIGQAYVLGELTVNSDGRSVTKMQFGRVDIKFKNDWIKKTDPQTGKVTTVKVPTKNPLDLGNDLKAATTDALKKCASELGIASDVYAPNEFKEIKISQDTNSLDNEEKLERIKDLINIEGIRLTEDDIMNLHRIIEQEEVASYDKAISLLMNNLPKTKNDGN